MLQSYEFMRVLFSLNCTMASCVHNEVCAGRVHSTLQMLLPIGEGTVATTQLA